MIPRDGQREVTAHPTQQGIQRLSRSLSWRDAEVAVTLGRDIIRPANCSPSPQAESYPAGPVRGFKWGLGATGTLPLQP